MTALRPHRLPAEPDEARYLQSLLQIAGECGRLTEDDFQAIQWQLMELLARLVRSYTGDDHSSVTEETAQTLLLSAGYAVSHYLKSLPDADAALRELKQRPLAELYKEGRQGLNQLFQRSLQLLKAARATKLVTANRAYNDTLKMGLGSFFLTYDIDFAAHETPASIDYPLCSDEMKLTGVEYIHHYLTLLALENKFCACFAAADIERLLQHFAPQSRELLINIFERTLINALGAVMAGQEAGTLNLPPAAHAALQRDLLQLTPAQLQQSLLTAAARLEIELTISDPALQAYIRQALPEISAQLHHALQCGQLDKLCPAWPETIDI